MTNRDSVLADSVNHLPHIQAFDLMIGSRFSSLELENILVYIIDNVDSSALPALAEQFDVLGFNGYMLATTELQKRAVIKRSIELHKYKGTIWAIKEALKTIGYDNIVITEHVNGHWARFSITLSTSAVLTAATAGDIIKMVSEYKNTRSHLDTIVVNILVDDTVTFVEDDAFVNESLVVDDEVRLTGSLKYDGTGMYDGTYDHSGDSDTVIITP